MTNLDGDELIRKLCAEFFQAADASKISLSEVENVDGIYGIAMYAEQFFRYTKELPRTRKNLTRAIERKLGARKAHKGSIDAILMTVAAGQADIPSRTKRALSQIQEETSATFKRIEPCFCVAFGNIELLRIGPVVIKPITLVADELSSYQTNFKIGFGTPFGLDPRQRPFKVNFPQLAWEVQVQCVRENTAAEALWLIDVALSLIRLSPGRFERFPAYGETEAHPTVPMPQSRSNVVISGSGEFSVGGWSLPNVYGINSSTFSATELEALDLRGWLVSDPPPNSVAERMNRGLGFLTRARRAEDSAERFLYFFTAIESLFTAQDASSPVSDTICRFTACVLTNDNATRRMLAKRLRKLYSIRSQLVHQGDRNVVQSDSSDLQEYAEHVFAAVLHQSDLTQKVGEFHEALREATYGTALPLDSDESSPAAVD